MLVVMCCSVGCDKYDVTVLDAMSFLRVGCDVASEC